MHLKSNQTEKKNPIHAKCIIFISLTVEKIKLVILSVFYLDVDFRASKQHHC